MTGMPLQRWLLLLAGLTFATAAWFGTGYHAEDEFQQVILLAEHLCGNADGAYLPIDHQKGWRSMALPLIAAGVFEAARGADIADPFTLTLLLRLLTAALALWVVQGFITAVHPSVRAENQEAFVILSWFLWFVPVLHVRFSGEAWSGLLFLRGLTLLLRDPAPPGWRVGAWWAAAALLRPAVLALPAGAVLWLLLVRRTGWRRLGGIAAGGAAAMALGIALDSIAYGRFTFSLWNYLAAALSGEEAHRFTALPWYQHLLFALKHPTPPIGALLLGAAIVLVALRPRHPALWLSLAFLIAHSLIPVKEPRFLFPLAPLMPWLLMAAWDALCARWPAFMRRDLVLRLLFPFAAVNAAALLVGIATPAGNGRIRLAEAIRARYADAPVRIDHLGDWRQWIPPFYLAPGSAEHFVERIVPDKEAPRHLVIAKESRGLDKVTSLERLAVATPPWAQRFLGWYGLEDGHDPLVLYRLTTENIGH